MSNGTIPMNIKVAIRPATAKDLEGIRQLQEQCFESEERYSVEILRHLYETSPIHLVAVTEQGDEIVGFLITMGACDYKECIGITIASFAIAEKYRKHGLGKAMLTTFVNVTENLIITHPQTGNLQTPDLILQVRESNNVAIHLYEIVGFTRDPQIMEDYYSKPVEGAYIMYKLGHPVDREQLPAQIKKAEEEHLAKKTPSPKKTLSPKKKVKKVVRKEADQSDWTQWNFPDWNGPQWNRPLVWGLAGLGVAVTGLAICARLVRGNKTASAQ